MQDNANIENLEAHLELRYGAPFMQGITDHLKSIQKNESHQSDMKDINSSVARSRARTRDLIRQYRGVRMEHRLALRSGGARADRVYLGYEEQFLRRQLQDAISLYRMANRDYHAVRRLTLERLFRIGLPSTRAAAG